MESPIKTKSEVSIYIFTNETKSELFESIHKKEISLSFHTQTEIINNDSFILLLSEIDKKITGYCLVVPLYAITKKSKQAVLISELFVKDQKSAKELLCEGVKFSFETGYHAAFAICSNKALQEIGFESITDFKISNIVYNELFGMDLTWNGFKKISKTLYTKTSFQTQNLSNFSLLKN